MQIRYAMHHNGPIKKIIIIIKVRGVQKLQKKKINKKKNKITPKKTKKNQTNKQNNKINQ